VTRKRLVMQMYANSNVAVLYIICRRVWSGKKSPAAKHQQATRASSLAQGQVLPAGSRSIVHTEKHQKNSCDLNLWHMTLKFNRVLQVVEQNFIMLMQRFMSYQQCTRFQTNRRLRSGISLEQIKQSTSRRRRYKLRLFARLLKTIGWTLVH